MKTKNRKKVKRLSDTCSKCDLVAWQYADDGTAYCEAHARWERIEVQRMEHPLDTHPHSTSVEPAKLAKATGIMVKAVKRAGYAEALWVAECLGMEWGVQWWESKLYIKLTDLQLVAFAAAMQTHTAKVMPKKKKAGKRGKKTKTARSKSKS